MTQKKYCEGQPAPLVRALLAAIASIALSAPVWADPVTLSGYTMREAVAGATVEIDTPIGTKVPVKYEADGSVSGEAGSVAFFLGSASDHGRWWAGPGPCRAAPFHLCVSTRRVCHPTASP